MIDLHFKIFLHYYHRFHEKRQPDCLHIKFFANIHLKQIGQSKNANIILPDFKYYIQHSCDTNKCYKRCTFNFCKLTNGH